MPENAMERVEVVPAWLTYKQAEMYSGLSRTTLWELIGSGAIRAAKVGKAVRISRESLDAFMQKSCEADKLV